ncbi:MAG: apolipoprotein N-acyltransferase [Roseovarius sp.]|nr:apolipoprotein N-acyltransferase [Roseovarius sp.]
MSPLKRHLGNSGNWGTWRLTATSAATGGLAAFGQAPWELWPLSMAGIALCYGLFSHALELKRAALTGWASGTGYFLVSLAWIVEPFLVDASRHGWMAPFALVLLCSGLALFWAISFALARVFGGGMAWAGAFAVGEWLRSWAFTGFPWAQTGHSLIDTSALYWASWVGSLGLSMIMVVSSMGLWYLISGRKALGSSVLAGFFAIMILGRFFELEAISDDSGPLVRLVQPNAPQHEKWDPDKAHVFYQRQMAFTRAFATADRPDRVVWPELSVPMPLSRSANVLEAISEASGNARVVLGIGRKDDGKYYNSLVHMDGKGDLRDIYDKSHLVPFGEYVPFANFFGRFGVYGFTAEIDSGYSAGSGSRLIEMGELGMALPLICYEGVFARDIARVPGRADFLLLITNDAWFGDISGPYQHLAQARVRSAEFGLPMVRVANTGISAMIDARGRVLASLPLGEANWIDARLPDPLPPTIYSRTGDVPIISLALFLMGIALRRKQVKASGNQ